MVECGIETWSQDEWIEYLADTADGFGSLAALVITAKDVQGAGQPIPGSPVLGKFGESGPESCSSLLGMVVVFEIPAAAKPPVTSIAGRFGPGVEQNTSSIWLPGIGQGGHQGLACTNVIRVFRQKGLQSSQQRRSIRVGGTWLGCDPLPECNLGVDVVTVGIDPSP